ncbi:hypothetical protein [Nocardia sp. NPDC052566]|uniref:hypothetical protein n=1 Tax=Nocardia sp. NPDC052566 TaxID=3364330 RepID=UPI0037C53E0F
MAKMISGIIATLDAEPHDADAFRWRTRFAGIARVLGDPDVDDRRAVDEVVESVGDLYAGGRNLADFYLARKDFDEQRRVNREFAAQLGCLREFCAAHPLPHPLESARECGCQARRGRSSR